MATTYTGRGGSTYRMAGRHPYNTPRSGSDTWTKTGRKTKGTHSPTTTPPQYKNCNEMFEWKINSYKTLYNQTRGPAKYTRPAPTILNNFANWINKGAVVQTVTRAQVAKWARTTKWNFSTHNPSATSCKNVLWTKFGKQTIKAVARTKSGSYMVATSPTWKGKPFMFPRYY